MRIGLREELKKDYSVYFFPRLIWLFVYDCRTDEKLSHARCEILKAVIVRNTVHWVMTLRSLLEGH